MGSDDLRNWTVLVVHFIPDNPLAHHGSFLAPSSPLIMFARKALSRGAQIAARQQGCSNLVQRRGYAAAAAASSPAPSSSLAYDISDAADIKIAARDTHRPTTKLALVAKAGTRYEPAPGLTVGLEEFAFKVHTQYRPSLGVIFAMS